MPDFKQQGTLYVPEAKDVAARAEVKRRVTIALEVTAEIAEEIELLVEVPELLVAVYNSVVANIDV